MRVLIKRTGMMRSAFWRNISAVVVRPKGRISVGVTLTVYRHTHTHIHPDRTHIRLRCLGHGEEGTVLKINFS